MLAQTRRGTLGDAMESLAWRDIVARQRCCGSNDDRFSPLASSRRPALQCLLPGNLVPAVGRTESAGKFGRAFLYQSCKFVQRNRRDGTRQSTRLGHLQSPASASGYCSSVSHVIACGDFACAKVPAVMLHHLKPCRRGRPGHGAADLLATNANVVKKTCDSPAGRQQREDARKAIRIPPPPGLR